VITLGELAAAVPGAVLTGAAEVTIRSLVYDSREVTSGSAFVALRGGYVDGHSYAEQAVGSGAIALIVEEQLPVDVPQLVVGDTRRDLAILANAFYGRPSEQLHVVGITGTDGKTTTSYILDHILRSAGHRTGMIGTVSVRIADETVDHETRQTTPESADIQRLLRAMVDARVDTAILEATSHGLDLHRLDHVQFRTGIVTNITQEHLEHHKTVEAYWRAKARLFETVAANHGVSVINLDDEGARSVMPFAVGSTRTITYSAVNPEAALFAAIESGTLAGSVGTVAFDGTTRSLLVPLVGTFNVANALAAIGGAIALDVPFNAAVEAVASVPQVPGRMTAIDRGQPFGVMVDYAHTPESLGKVLSLMRASMGDGRLIVVFGSAGERDTVKRPIQGRIAAELADVVIVTNEDPRYEDAATIVDEIATGAVTGGAFDGQTLFRIVDRRDAIAKALDLAGPGDAILLAGKGHERSIIWNGIKHPWDEAAVARELLAERGWDVN
jgi:UDP-N-acetylmuramoyl-L-alanyl-D-glutamate--2,6-diaminopimelate ligase